MIRHLIILIGLFVYCSVQAELRPAVAIIIDDIGYRALDDRRALELKGDITYAILPHTPGAQDAIDVVKESNRELMLHMPMQKSHSFNKAEAPGTLKNDMDWLTFVGLIQKNLAAVPGIVAVNNHEGSGLTANSERMRWLMQELARHPGLAFIDSRTTHHTVAQTTAHEHGLATTRRDVFLDHEPEKIAEQFELLIKKAKREGTALGIAHPHKTTIRFLRKNLPRLEQEGVNLIPISQLLARRSQHVTTREAHVQSIGSSR